MIVGLVNEQQNVEQLFMYRYLRGRLLQSQIGIDCGIFTFSKTNGTITSINEFYKTGPDSHVVQENEFVELSTWKNW